MNIDEAPEAPIEHKTRSVGRPLGYFAVGVSFWLLGFLGILLSLFGFWRIISQSIEEGWKTVSDSSNGPARIVLFSLLSCISLSLLSAGRSFLIVRARQGLIRLLLAVFLGLLLFLIGLLIH